MGKRAAIAAIVVALGVLLAQRVVSAHRVANPGTCECSAANRDTTFDGVTY